MQLGSGRDIECLMVKGRRSVRDAGPRVDSGY